MKKTKGKIKKKRVKRASSALPPQRAKKKINIQINVIQNAGLRPVYNGTAKGFKFESR